MRLQDVLEEQYREWRKARMEGGKEKYHHLDHKRDLMVDIVEEAIDIQNIAGRFLQHHSRKNVTDEARNMDTEDTDIEGLIQSIGWLAWDIIVLAGRIDKCLVNVDDSCGGQRVWWSDQKNTGPK